MIEKLSFRKNRTVVETEAVKQPIPKPALTLRPHHIVQTDFIRNAFIGHVNQAPINRFHALPPFNLVQNGWDADTDPSGYYRDVYGITEAQYTTTQLKRNRFLTKVSQLPDEAFIKLDLEPDGICNTCVHGNHCTATNFTDLKEARSIIDAEYNCLTQIGGALEVESYTFGKDYFLQSTTHILYDYRGADLRTPGVVIPLDVVFPSLTVQAGVLRSLIRHGYWQTELEESSNHE